MRKKIILLLILTSFTQISAAGEITGAFGVNLGDSIASIKERLIDPDPNSNIFYFDAESPHFYFDKYSVRTTPKTNKIYEIRAKGKIPANYSSASVCENRVKELAKVIEKKYPRSNKKIINQPKTEEINDIAKKAFYPEGGITKYSEGTIRFYKKDRLIQVHCGWSPKSLLEGDGGTILIFYQDLKNKKKSEKEEFSGL